MCGRYAMALRPSQIRRMLQDDDMPVDDAPADEGDGAPRQSYNFAPGYHGVVYRADVQHPGPQDGSPLENDREQAPRGGPEAEDEREDAESEGDDRTGGDDVNRPADDRAQANDAQEKQTGQGPRPIKDGKTAFLPDSARVCHKLQSMRWGLIPAWTRRSPDYASMLKTINCRDDSLATPGGMWESMKKRKRCIVVAQGFYEWRKKGKEKMPHYVRRKDGKLMCFAGLWDCVRFDHDNADGSRPPQEPLYTYTIITTDSNAQLRFLHDRMPVILEPGSEAMFKWLDPRRTTWTGELQALLRPFAGELEVYPVSKDVGKVGNNSPSFIIPVSSRENKGNIANFFANAAAEKKNQGANKEAEGVEEEEEEEKREEDQADAERASHKGVKREREATPPSERSPEKTSQDEPPTKRPASLARSAMTPQTSPVKPRPRPTPTKGKISAVKNEPRRSPAKARAQQAAAKGSMKITSFFGAKT
ncbi:hypothetical protein VTJ83DRAFT_7495 [Remersonia thermophila]|uniref:DUF159 domain protein n=1 Tax=Remersonia thermophila TaxID=72144 RepID=A0ABR4D3M8_9PEZI